MRETKQFVGRDIKVQMTVVASHNTSVDGGGHGGGKNGAGGKTNVSSTTNGGIRRPAMAGINLLLLHINGPHKISTMTKTGAPGYFQGQCWTGGGTEEEGLGEGCVSGKERLFGPGGSQEAQEGKRGTRTQ